MALTSFIPELWSARLLRNLEKAHVGLSFVNHDYEGEIKKMGDTVHINTIGAVTIGDYVPGTAIAAPETLSTADQTLTIDKAKYFNFQVDDVNAAQAAGPIMDSAMQEAAYGISDVVDQDIFGAMADACTIAKGNRLAHATLTTPADAYKLIVDLRTALTKANVPSQGRKIAVSPDFYALLLQDKDHFVGVGSDKADERMENGYVGKVAGFEVYESNNIPAFGNDEFDQVIATVPMATTFAEQVTEVNAYRPESAFADAVKGLDVYGVKVVRDAAIAAVDYELA